MAQNWVAVYGLLSSVLPSVKLKKKKNKTIQRQPDNLIGWDLQLFKLFFYLTVMFFTLQLIWKMKRGIKLKLRFFQSASVIFRNEHSEWLLSFPISSCSRSFPGSSWVQENTNPSSGPGRINQFLSTWDHLSPQKVCTAESMWHTLVNPRSSTTYAAHLPPNSRVCLMELRVRLTTAICRGDGEERVLMERMVRRG